ncbi:DUF3427 domain-containing protein [Planctomycetota bacterium]|nr:DUF3427 domain-containing protein [Planctomycetota bacterium]
MTPEHKIKPLKRYETYTRDDIQRIFKPNEEPSKGGPWAMSGIAKPSRAKGDYVFMTSLESERYINSLKPDGVLTWDSQDRHDFTSPYIKDFIGHDHHKNNIHLFLCQNYEESYKKSIKQRFFYMGKLAYINHKPTKTNPVSFQWQILNFNPPKEVLAAIEPFPNHPDLNDNNLPPQSSTVQNILVLEDISPRPQGHTSQNSNTVNRAVKIDYDARNKANRIIGLQGEKLVLEYERDRLTKAGQPELAQKITHTSMLEGDGTGFDIHSYKENGDPLYIEVKTTKGGPHADIYITINEQAFSERESANYAMYRVYDFNPTLNTGKLYIRHGNISDHFGFTPLTFSGTLKSSKTPRSELNVSTAQAGLRP